MGGGVRGGACGAHRTLLRGGGGVGPWYLISGATSSCPLQVDLSRDPGYDHSVVQYPAVVQYFHTHHPRAVTRRTGYGENDEVFLGRHVCRTIPPPKNIFNRLEQRFENAIKDPRNDPKAFGKFLALLRLLKNYFHRHFSPVLKKVLHRPIFTPKMAFSSPWGSAGGATLRFSVKIFFPVRELPC